MPSFAWAVYAPIPEQEQGKALTYRLGSAIYHDSNIFGGATGEISSLVYNFNGALSYNGSLSDQTFASAAYELNNDHIVDRPGQQNLTSHSLNARLAHAFSPATSLDVAGAYNIAKNPQSLLAGVPLNTDQSNDRGQLDLRFVTAASQKMSVAAKYRLITYRYDNPTLAADLDRTENLFGGEWGYALLPETKLLAEYRYQAIGYRSAAIFKDKTSHFLLAGMDYNPSEKTMLAGRVGGEARNRSAAPDTTSPYVELSARYTYAEGSFLASGYTYTLEEPSDVNRFTDTKVNRIFVNLQHRLSGLLTAAGSLSYEPSELQGRGRQMNVAEKTTRLGLGLSWQPSKNWTVNLSGDLDRVNSEDASRGQSRNRYGLSARYTF